MASLWCSVARVYQAREWLIDVDRIKSINIPYTRYLMKGVAEVQRGYISNCAFIVAAILEGFEYKIDHYSYSNLMFNTPHKSIKKLVKETRKFIL